MGLAFSVRQRSSLEELLLAIPLEFHVVRRADGVLHGVALGLVCVFNGMRVGFF